MPLKIPFAAESIPGISIVHVGELDALDISVPATSARIFFQGAHIASWTPAGEKPVLFLSSQTHLTPGVPIRGGIPLIAPWFGPSDAGLHGWIRIREWELTMVRQRADDAIETKWRLAPHADERNPTAGLEFNLEATFGACLSVKLTVCNTSEQPLSTELALHAYWNVHAQDIQLSNVNHGGIDRLNHNAPIPDGPCEPLTGQTIDRFYPFDSEIIIHDPAQDRTISVSSAESRQSVIWNPGIAGCQENADLDNEDWKHFVCVEATRVRDHAYTLAAGESASLSLTASLRH